MENQENIEAVQRMQDFINAHLKERITMRMLADAAGYSPWHAAKIFKDLTGKSPFDCIRMMRLSRAAVRLREEEVKVIDVAFDFLFDTHEGFTRAFSRQFGITPRNFTQYKPPLRLFIPENVHEKYLTLERGKAMTNENQKTNTIFVQVVHRPARKLIRNEVSKPLITLPTATKWAARCGMCYAVSNRPFTSLLACGFHLICADPEPQNMPKGWKYH